MELILFVWWISFLVFASCLCLKQPPEVLSDQITGYHLTGIFGTTFLLTLLKASCISIIIESAFYCSLPQVYPGLYSVLSFPMSGGSGFRPDVIF